MEKKINTHQDFLDNIKISEKDCWEWQRSKNKEGYGRFSIKDVLWKTHRYSYSHYKGEIGVMKVLHKCDNPSCCNPDHLFLGNLSENTLDMIRKGRGRKDYTTVDNVLDIRELNYHVVQIMIEMLMPPKI